MASVAVGTTIMALLMNLIPFHDERLVRGSLLVAHGNGRLGVRHGLHGHRPGVLRVTNTGKWIRRDAGSFVVLVRVVNPAYPEAMMLSILFMNMLAPLVDHYVVKANIKKRLARNAA